LAAAAATATKESSPGHPQPHHASGVAGAGKEEDLKKRNKLRDFLQKEKQQVKGAFADIFEYSSQDLKKTTPHAHHSEGQWHGPTHNAECSQSSVDIVCRCQLLRSFSDWSGTLAVRV
jgi:hypothetical protein